MKKRSRFASACVMSLQSSVVRLLYELKNRLSRLQTTTEIGGYTHEKIT